MDDPPPPPQPPHKTKKILSTKRKGHAVCIAYQFQGHINAMFKLAKVLHSKGIYITFLNAETNHKKFLEYGGPNALDGLPNFRFETLPDGSTASDLKDVVDFPSFVQFKRKNRLASLIRLINKLNNLKDNPDSTATLDNFNSIPPPVTCIIADGFVTFAIDAAEEFGIPIALYWTFGACSFMSFYHYQSIMETRGHPEGHIPAFQADDNTVIDWIPGMKGMRVRDLPTFGNFGDDPAHLAYKIKYTTEAIHRSLKASAIILNTFDELEPDFVRAMSSLFPTIYTISPVQFLITEKEEDGKYQSLGSCNLQKEEPLCLQWLDSKQPNSVLYISFGSIAVLTPEQVLEFGWGIANSNFDFLWIINPDVAENILPPELMNVIKERGFIANWCPQEQVLNHPSVGGFFTHAGWNSLMESVSAGLPLLCYPFTGDQPTNCRYICSELEMGMEIDRKVSRDQVERLIGELMSDNVMKERVAELKKLAEKATAQDGSSSMNLDRLVNNFCISSAI